MITNAELLARLLLAGLLGGVIGFERERLSWAAGLRTHMLVCVGATLMMLVSLFGFSDVQGQKNVTLDPSRIAAQVVSGIGFLGAGTILLRGEVVRGLTTAASLWAVAGIGLAAGAGMYACAAGATVIVLAILAGVKPLERRFIAARLRRNLELLVEPGAVSLKSVHDAISNKRIRVKQFVLQRSEANPDLDFLSIALSPAPSNELDAIYAKLRRLPGVLECHLLK